MPVGREEYRDRLFTFIFGSEEHRDWTLSLYNAVNGTEHNDPEWITITTIREVLYLGMHNDVSFLLANVMSLYEQQSTFCPNMPLRMLQYAGSLYEKHVRRHHMNKYGRRLLALPAPRLVVFYNGVDEMTEERTLRLSDSFPPGVEADMDVRVRMVNVNPGMSERMKAACAPLAEYTWLVEAIRAKKGEAGTTDAIDQALESMPEGFLIRSYLLEHKAEVRDMLLTEYNEAEAMELFREEGRAQGREEGREEGRAQGREEGREEGRAQGRDQTIVKSIASVTRNLGCSAEKALEVLGVSKSERARYLAML